MYGKLNLFALLLTQLLLTVFELSAQIKVLKVASDVLQ